MNHFLWNKRVKQKKLHEANVQNIGHGITADTHPQKYIHTCI